MTGSRIYLVALSLLFFCLAPVGVAGAADTYASPDGTGTACTQAAPCSLEQAGQIVTPEADVHIGPGQYGSPSAPLPYRVYATAERVHFIGHPDATLYIDSSSTDSSISLTDFQQIRGNGMEVHSFDPSGVTLYGNTLADRVWVRTTADDSTACAIYKQGASTGGTFNNSVCFADTSTGGKGLFFHADNNDGIGSAVGVTAVATGTNSVGIGVENTGVGGGGMTSSSDFFVYLSIANATGAGSLDLSSVNDSALNRACLLTFEVASVTGGSGQCGGLETGAIREAPDFVSPGSDFHLKPGSSLIKPIDGTPVSSTPEVDLDGFPRDAADPSPGAYERQAPLASTGAATSVSLTGATLNGQGQTSYGTGSARFEFGTTTAYGRTTPALPVGRYTPAENLSQAVGGLNPGTTYHARLVVTSPDSSVVRGRDITFRTTATRVCRVPKIKGLKLASAKKRLKRANCRLGKVKRLKPRGKFVRRQSPKAGKVIKGGSKVKVSIGKKPRR